MLLLFLLLLLLLFVCYFIKYRMENGNFDLTLSFFLVFDILLWASSTSFQTHQTVIVVGQKAKHVVTFL